MTRTRMGLLAGIAALAAIGLGTGIGAAVAGGGGGPASPASGTPAPPASVSPGYSWYRSMMSQYASGSGMMGGTGGGWMMGSAGYQWMMGGTGAPGWMRGGTLPGSMMGTSHDPGKVMGALWANAPGPRVSAQEAAQLGSQVPAGANADRGRRTVTFTRQDVHLVVVASPAGGPDETFRIAGMVNPAITVPAGARVSLEVINADPDTAHGLVVTASDARSSWVPMMTAAPAFSGSALWFLGNPTSAGMHAGTLTFTAATAGTYHYLCAVPGHAQKGMTGTFIVSAR